MQQKTSHILHYSINYFRIFFLFYDCVHYLWITTVRLIMMMKVVFPTIIAFVAVIYGLFIYIYIQKCFTVFYIYFNDTSIYCIKQFKLLFKLSVLSFFKFAIHFVLHFVYKNATMVYHVNCRYRQLFHFSYFSFKCRIQYC